MFAHGQMHPHEPGVGVEDRGGNVVDLAADESAHRHVELEVHDLEPGAAEERFTLDISFCRHDGAGGHPACRARDDQGRGWSAR